MHARSTNIHGDPARIDDGIRHLRTQVLPDLASADGCYGLSALADRASGRMIVATS